MSAKIAAQKEVPWCTAFLCIGAILCHTAVLVGNLRTSSAVGGVGSSVKGWSEVGLGLAEALHEEFDGLLSNVTYQLTDAINRTMEAQDMIDSVLSMMGDAAATSGAAALNQLALVQDDVRDVEQADPLAAVMKTVTQALKQLPTFQESLLTLQGMMENLKPALMQVGIWVETFADKVQATVETFGTTVDRVQKIFDSLMSKLSPEAGEGADVMQHETFNLFDTDGSGQISEDDLWNCADLYAMNALKGEKAKELIDKYDASGDGEIDQQEFPLLVEDESISGIMATVLRAYAKRLSMVAGNVAAARMRDEVASNVVKYFQLVCSKNLTKVGWVSEMLTNRTLPMPFTADVMAELALQKDDPNTLTTADVGEVVIGMMMTLNSDYTLEAVDLMSSAEHWSSEGFDEDDQPFCVEQVTKWTQSGPEVVKILQKNMIELERRRGHPNWGRPEDSFIEQNVTYDVKAEEQGLTELEAGDRELLEVMSAMPAMAKRLTQERMRAHRQARWHSRAQRRGQRFNTKAKRFLLNELLHGRAALDGTGDADRALQALSKGVPAKPETLLFAQWLSANATTTANRFQAECFAYTGESSSALDAFNTQIQGMVKKISTFINLMKKYATTSGIQHMEDMVNDFAASGMHDVFMVVGKMIVAALEGKAKHVSELQVHRNHTATSLLELSSRRFGAEHCSAAALLLLDFTQPDGGFSIKGASAERAARRFAGPRQGSVPQPWSARAHGNSERPRQFPRHAQRSMVFQAPDPDAVPDISDVWEQVAITLHEMEKVLPTAIELLKFARKEVSAVAANLDSIFDVLGDKGKATFVKAATLYAELWGAYFFFVFSLTAAILFYAFWASGWFGGPQPPPKEMEKYEPPRSFADRVKCCWDACCRCCVYSHDKESCFWSCIILFQVIVFLLFIMTIVFVLLAGIQMFIGSSCAQIYILGDTKVCTETLDQLATFLETFRVAEGEVPLSMSCEHHNLLTCDLIHDKMLQAGILVVAGSFLAVVLSFELIFAIAMIHERAVWRRTINAILQDREPKDADVDGDAGAGAGEDA